MTTLIIGDEQTAQIRDLMVLAGANPIDGSYLARMAKGFDASDPTTRPRDADVIPLHFTIDLPIDVRVTYTEEDQPIGLCRHLSVSIDRKGYLPAPPIVDELLGLFGFAGRLECAGAGMMIWPEHYASGRIAVNALELRSPAPAPVEVTA